MIPKKRRLWPWTPRRFFGGEVKTQAEWEHYDIRNIHNRIFAALNKMKIRPRAIERIKFQAARGNLAGSLKNELSVDEKIELMERVDERHQKAKALFKMRKNAKARARREK